MIKNWINGAIATCAFEIKRSFTIQRNAVSAILAFFPPVMISILVLGPRAVGGSQIPFAEFVTLVLVALVCLLSLLLWATPNVYSELEGKSWTFIASRPGGRIGCFLGKFLAAVISAFAICTIALTLSILILTQIASIEYPFELWWRMMVIFLLACFAYSAVFSMIGTIIYRRAMVVAVGYVMVWEGLVANVPALINRLTLQHHLKSVGVEWITWIFPGDKNSFLMIFGDIDVAFHLWMLGVLTIGALFVGSFVITNRQYVTKDET